MTAGAAIRTCDPQTHDWRLSGPVGPVSLTATTAAPHALADLVTADETATEALLHGTSLVVSLLLEDDPRIQPIYACAHRAAAIPSGNRCGRREPGRSCSGADRLTHAGRTAPR
ncbi:hypothetical protein [Nocardia grenadensis]